MVASQEDVAFVEGRSISDPDTVPAPLPSGFPARPQGWLRLIYQTHGCRFPVPAVVYRLPGPCSPVPVPAVKPLDHVIRIPPRFPIPSSRFPPLPLVATGFQPVEGERRTTLVSLSPSPVEGRLNGGSGAPPGLEQ
jgi:hypothetical protein